MVGARGYMKAVALLVAMVLLASGPAIAEQAAAQVRDRIEASADGEHPRLFLDSEQAEVLKEKIEANPLLGRAWQSIQRQADAMLELEPMERRQVGRRLLGVSRTVLKRVGYLSLAYRITGERQYAERAEQEMLAAAGFSDWNPSHFLDVGEMTAALAIGYDWLHDELSEDSRRAIREAIVSKGLETSFEHAGWWVTTTNNWSQVCHAGLTMGALAVMEDEPELAERITERALENMHRPMGVYGPNGAYPEGPSYWAYGTSYNVLLIDALASALGTDFGLSDHEQFMASPVYYLHAHGPTLRYFNYSDGGENASVSPAMFWFARQLEQPELLWIEQRKLKRFVEGRRSADGAGQRLLPFLLVWAGDVQEAQPRQLHYKDEGPTPIGIHRSGWDERATYVGFKAGTPAENHAHMDIGSFVMESDGVRWAIDLGAQGYNSLESEGIDLWNSAQDGERWTVFRLNNHSHNTLVVNGELQRVEGFAPIETFSDEEGKLPYTRIDMTEVYEGQLAAAKRSVGLRDGAVIVLDEIEAGEDAAEVRWGMVTRAEVEITGDGEAVLRQDGETLNLRVLEEEGVELEIYETADPPRDYDADNPGTRMIGFKIQLEPGESRRLTVLLLPGRMAAEPEVQPLQDW